MSDNRCPARQEISRILTIGLHPLPFVTCLQCWIQIRPQQTSKTHRIHLSCTFVYGILYNHCSFHTSSQRISHHALHYTRLHISNLDIRGEIRNVLLFHEQLSQFDYIAILVRQAPQYVYCPIGLVALDKIPFRTNIQRPQTISIMQYSHVEKEVNLSPLL